MKSKLVLFTYNRPELLECVLHNLLLQKRYIPEIQVIDDHSSDERVAHVLKKYRDLWGVGFSSIRHEVNAGLAVRTNQVLHDSFKTGGYDSLIMLDSDIVMESADWFPKMIDFLSNHPEAGIVIPDRPGCYLRLKRPTYQEVEWAITFCYGVTKKVYKDFIANDFVGPKGSWFDENMVTSWDCDTCYRLRMLGYRIALLPSIPLSSLGEDSSTISDKLGRGVTAFNKKWNERLLGRYVYKSPLMLRWEQFPLNVKFRQMLCAQDNQLSIVGGNHRLCGHEAEIVSQMHCKNNYPRPEMLRKVLDLDIFLSRTPTIDPELAEGRRLFDIDKDLLPFSLKENP